MKKLVLSAVAVAAFAIGGAAQADLIDGVGNTISRLFGIPYNPYPSDAAPVANVYRDQWGRTVHLDAYNRPIYIEQNGQLIPYGGAAGTVALAPSYDRDADGVDNRYDRFPYDARYR